MHNILLKQYLLRPLLLCSKSCPLSLRIQIVINPILIAFGLFDQLVSDELEIYRSLVIHYVCDLLVYVFPLLSLLFVEFLLLVLLSTDIFLHLLVY